MGFGDYPSNPERTKIVQKWCFPATSRAKSQKPARLCEKFSAREKYSRYLPRPLNSRSAESHLRDDAFFAIWRRVAYEFRTRFIARWCAT
jgi:hypothetical protein